MRKKSIRLLKILILILAFCSLSVGKSDAQLCFEFDVFDFKTTAAIVPLCEEVEIEIELDNRSSTGSCPNNRFDLQFSFSRNVYRVVESLPFQFERALGDFDLYSLLNIEIPAGEIRFYTVKFQLISTLGEDDNSTTIIDFLAKEIDDPASVLIRKNFAPNSGVSTDGSTISDLQSRGILDAIADCRINRDLVVEGNLSIDKDWCFRTNFLNAPPTNPFDFDQITMLEGSTITVQSGNELTIDRAVLKACDANWNGIIVESGASLILQDAYIQNANVGITLLEGANLSMEQSQITDGVTGILVAGNANIELFENNLLDDLEVGVQVENTSQIINLRASQGNENVVTASRDGFFINNANATIHYNFINGPDGIISVRSTWTDARYNTVAASSRGIYGNRSIMRVRDNIIKPQGDNLRDGVSMYRCNDTDILDNTITAQRGVNVRRSESTEIGRNDITADGQVNPASYGVLINTSGIRIFNNDIKTNVASAGIQTRRSSGNIIENNNITGLENASTAGIRLIISDDEIVRENTISGSLDDGIMVDNANRNTFECNSISANLRGIFVMDNSAVQTITGNSLDASIDVLTRSVLGIQFHHNNDFPNVGYIESQLSTDQTLLSRFVIDEEVADLPDSRFPDEFVEKQQDFNNDNFNCAEALPGLLPPDSECAHANDLAALQLTDPESYFINAYHLYKSYLKAAAVPQWPACLQQLWNNESSCGLKELVTAEVALQNHIQDQGSTNQQLEWAVTELSGAYDNNASSATLQPLLDQTQILQQQYQNNLETELQQQLITVSGLACASPFFNSWRKTYQLNIQQFLTDNDWTSGELVELQFTAGLCPAEHGDVVHWARAMLTPVSDNRFDLPNTCTPSGPQLRQQNPKELTPPIALYPNPAHHSVEISGLDPAQDWRYELRDLSGKLITAQPIISFPARLSIAELPEGLYLVRLFDQQGFRQALKLLLSY
ncbi:MAG: NosD domain-containing protein [Bacteroidota bacterium]